MLRGELSRPASSMNLSVARLQTLDWEVTSQRFIPLINLALVALLAFTGARLMWLLIPFGMSDTAPGTGAYLNPAAASVRAEADMGAIMSAHLFGLRELKPETAAVPVDAPDTRLDLTLTGIFAATIPEESRALIKDASGKQRSYAVNDDLPGGAKISAIYPDRVILLRGGRYETLRLEPNKSPSPPAQATQLPTVAPPGGVSPAALSELKNARQQVLANPGKAGEYVRIQPVYNEGKLQGYRLYPGKNRDLFNNLGLQPGELVTSVNGVALDDPAKSLQMLGDLAQAGNVTLTLERAGQVRTVNLNLQ